VVGAKSRPHIVDEIVARRFVLVDEENLPRAILQMFARGRKEPKTNDGAWFAMMNKKGEYRLSMNALGGDEYNRGEIEISDSNGKRLEMGGYASIVFFGESQIDEKTGHPHSTSRLGLGLNGISLYDPTHALNHKKVLPPLIKLTLGEGYNSDITIRDKNYEPIWKAP